MKNTCKVYRTLYGYNNSSCYGRYKTYVEGMLDKFNGLRVAKSLFIISNENATDIIAFLEENNATVKTWEVIPGPDECGVIGKK